MHDDDGQEDAGVRPLRLIVVTPYALEPTWSGGRLRNRHLVQQLLDRGHAVEHWAFAAEDVGAGRGTAIPGVPTRWLSGRVRAGRRAKLAALVSPYAEAAWACPPPAISRAAVEGVDAVILCQAHVGRLLAPFLRLGVPVVLNEQNVETDLVRQLARISPTPLSRLRLRLDARKLARFEATLLRTATLVTSVSPVDAGRLRAMAPAARIELLPSGADVAGVVSRDHVGVGSDRLVLLGTLGYLPNLDAATWLVREILPIVQRSRPRAHVALVGSSPPGSLATLAALAGPAVQLVGPIDDVAGELAASDVFVVPLRAGSGVRLKVLEAFAHGIPVVATSRGVEGLDVRDGVHLAIADDAASFAAAVVRLLEDAALRLRFSTEARRLVEDCYDWRAIGGRFEALLSSVARRDVGAGEW